MMQIFSGSSNSSLSNKLVESGFFTLGGIELSAFTNGELRVRITEKRVESEVTVLQSLSNPTEQYLVEFALICDALKRSGASKITAIIPWLGYSKQDKVFLPGEPLSVKVIANLLQTAPIEKLYTFDLHNLAIMGFFDIPLINLSAKPLFVEYFGRLPKENLLVAAPDAGAVKAATQFAQELGADVVYLDKKRDLVSGNVTIQGISRAVEGKDILMIDDLISTGATLIETSKYLKDHGAKNIRVGATHHLYVPGVQEKLDNSAIDELVVTDTIEKPATTLSNKLRLLSVAQLISNSSLNQEKPISY